MLSKYFKLGLNLSEPIVHQDENRKILVRKSRRLVRSKLPETPTKNNSLSIDENVSGQENSKDSIRDLPVSKFQS